ncbi:MAG: 50S ribosomal protein L13 [Prevotella sp.]|jgi:large subunit ribosomal protein L13|nr:50S ribosomal protein L13 [Prevotella sp.]
MDTLSYKTISANKETAKKEWVVVDATDQVVGRLASKVAKLIRGKYKPNFTPHVDCGDNVIIINAEKVVFTGKKETDKVYTRYTGYPGGQRFNTPEELRKKPFGAERIIRHAVKGMLPKGILGRHLLDNLYIYNGTEHKHEAQKPKAIDINQYK